LKIGLYLTKILKKIAANFLAHPVHEDRNKHTVKYRSNTK